MQTNSRTQWAEYGQHGCADSIRNPDLGGTLMLVSLAFMAWDKLTRSWQGCGGMMAVMFQKTPQQPSQMKVFRTKKCNAILLVTGILVMGISNIYIYIQIIYIPFVTKLLEMALEFANQREGKHPGSRSQMSRVFSNPKGSAKKTHETAVSGFHPC